MLTFQKSLPQDALFVKVIRTIARPVPETFAYIVPVDVTHIFPRKGDMPGNVSTTVTTEWGQLSVKRAIRPRMADPPS